MNSPEILIKNMRTDKFENWYPYEVRVDRISILGNPFKMNHPEQRDKVIEAYQTYFDEKSKNDSAFRAELNRLARIYRLYKKLHLYCWCAPKRCHAEIIRDWILANT